jgi:hypothetical protein
LARRLRKTPNLNPGKVRRTCLDLIEAMEDLAAACLSSGQESRLAFTPSDTLPAMPRCKTSVQLPRRGLATLATASNTLPPFTSSVGPVGAVSRETLWFHS